jgi:hypothetical protein
MNVTILKKGQSEIQNFQDLFRTARHPLSLQSSAFPAQNLKLRSFLLEVIRYLLGPFGLASATSLLLRGVVFEVLFLESGRSVSSGRPEGETVVSP